MNAWIRIGALLLILAGVILCQPLLADVQSKLKALEAAHESGILTDEEYAHKKAELEAQLRAATPPLDEATKQKLQALEAAHQAGILSDEEYSRKKAELMGQQAVDNAAPIESGTNLTLYSDPQRRFQFQHPPDWNAQALPERQGIALTHGKATVSVLVFPGDDDAHKLIKAVAEQIRGQWQNYRELLRGEWKIGGQATPFVEFTGMNPQGMLAHSQMTVFVTSGTGYVFLLTAPENEFSDMQPVRETLLNSFQVGGASLVRREGKTYHHAVGFSFWYPTGWTVKENEDLIQLVPPNPGSTAEGPNELYFVSAESVAEEGIQRPDDPRIAEYLDMQVQSLSPLLKRAGQVSFIDMAEGKGAVLSWEAGTTQGSVVSAQAFVSIIKEHVVVLIGIGLKDRLEARNSDLRQIFASFGSGAAPLLPAVTVSNEQGQANIATSPNISANEIGDANWGFKFQPPQGWKSQKSDRVVVLGHNTIAGAILVLPHTATSFQEVQEQMQKGLSEEEVQLSLTSSLQTIGSNAVAGDYAGIFNGQQVKAHGIGTFSPYGGGAYIIALTIPDKYSPQLSSAADAIAKGIQFFKVDVSDLVTHFSGTWVNYTKNTETKMVLAPNGEYFNNYESSYSSGEYRYSNPTVDWGIAGQNQTRGRWTVRGNREQGVIIIKSQDGSETVIEYKVHVEKGQTYWNEYWFNGALYSKQ